MHRGVHSRLGARIHGRSQRSFHALRLCLVLDLLITNARIIDGSGNRDFPGAVGVDDNSVRIFRGDPSSLVAERVIDAERRIVCPGFIDVHAHSGLVMLDDPRHEAKVRQGVTTELIGVDGNSYAPFRSQADLADFVRMNAGLDGDPQLHQSWSTVAEYLMAFDRKAAVNVAYVIGNSPLRINAVGWKNREAASSQLRDMKAMLREGMEEGALGMSTGLDYPPGSYASTDELVALCEQAAKLGGIYHTHVRYSLGDRFLDPFREAIDIGRRSGIAVHVTHFYQRIPVSGAAQQMLDLLEDARAEGLDVTFDSYPYTLSSTRLTIVLPGWSQDGGPQRLLEALRSPETRKRLREEVAPRGPSWQEMWVTNFAKPANHMYEGRSIAEVAVLRGTSEVDAICDLLLDEDLRVCYVSAGGNGNTLPKFVAHPLSMVGSDGVLLGDFPSPRTYGTFPIILAEYVRMESFLSLPEAVRKMTSFPAQRLNLGDRGLLRDGMRADIVVFDPATISAPATRRAPKQYPSGIDFVIVNGTVVVESGRHTGALPGRALRRGRVPS
jgi:N-acyl-D-amino-acid deacylase